MAVIKANKVEFEVIKQNVNGAAARYLIKLSFEPTQYESKEIVSLILTNKTPYITFAEEDERMMNVLQCCGPDGHTTKPFLPPEEVFGNEPTKEELLDAVIDNENQLMAKQKLTPEDVEWRSKK
jgi:hypothetical protein|tara:strand:- start:757 stop:1128 length:372 start_codon:yes stop_codon:yes gene_type:complete